MPYLVVRQSGGKTQTMSKNPQQKDEALEALDFIVNVLKEHERDLDKLISELATVTEQMGDTSELSGKVDKVEEKISGLQKEVTTLISAMSGNQKAVPMVVAEQAMAPANIAPIAIPGAPTVRLHCKKWDEFQTLALGAQTVSYNYKEEEKLFQADALKGNQVVSYSGPLPNFSTLLKSYIVKDLRVPEQSIFEGVLEVS
jgi:DNA repair ATPase RecN